jgi:hypothetical protein
VLQLGLCRQVTPSAITSPRHTSLSSSPRVLHTSPPCTSPSPSTPLGSHDQLPVFCTVNMSAQNGVFGFQLAGCPTLIRARKHGLFVKLVYVNTPASKPGGLVRGDRIVEVGSLSEFGCT